MMDNQQDKGFNKNGTNTKQIHQNTYIITDIKIQNYRDEPNIQILKQVIVKNINIFITQHQQIHTNTQDKKDNRLIFTLKNSQQKQYTVIVYKINIGFVNEIYQINQNYILKIQKQIIDVTLHQIQLFHLAKQVQAKVPTLIDFDEFHNKKYMLMTKMYGDRLWKYWPLLTEEQKFNAIQQICSQLKKLHSIYFAKYSSRRPYLFQSIKDAIVWYNIQAMKNVKKSQIYTKLDNKTLQNLRYIQKYMEDNANIMNQPNEKPVFVHNDLHFGNILYDIDKHQITGILDFDFSRQLNKNYQLWHIIQFLQKPAQYVQQQYLHLWKNYQINNQILFFKTNYPQLFERQKLADKIRLYVIDQLVFYVQSGQLQLFNYKFQVYYHTTWLDNILAV